MTTTIEHSCGPKKPQSTTSAQSASPGAEPRDIASLAGLGHHHARVNPTRPGNHPASKKRPGKRAADCDCRGDFSDPINLQPHAVAVLRIGGYGDIRTKAVGGTLWCSRSDVCKVAGLPIPAAGKLDEGEICVFVDLARQKTAEACIPLPTVFRIFRRARGGARLIGYLRMALLTGANLAELTYKSHPDAVLVCGIVGEVIQAQPGSLRVLRYYDPEAGELRVIDAAGRFWIDVNDLGRYAGLEPGVVVHLAGDQHTANIPNSIVSNADEQHGGEMYVSHAAAHRILNALCYGGRIAASLQNWISNL